MGVLEIVPELDSVEKWSNLVNRRKSFALGIAFFLELDRMCGAMVGLSDMSIHLLYDLVPPEPETHQRTGLPSDYPASLFTENGGKVQVMSPLAQKGACRAVYDLLCTAGAVRNREHSNQDIDQWMGMLNIMVSDYKKYKFWRYAEISTKVISSMRLPVNLKPYEKSLGTLLVVAAHVIGNWRQLG